MKSFKSYLTEAPSYDKKIIELISYGHLPITPKITEYLGFGDKKVVFHATTLEHLKNLKKTGKSKKAISTFTRGLHGLVFYAGMSVNPDVVAKLEGNAIIEFESDAFSHPDKQGRRWINTRGSKKSKFLQDALMNKTIRMIYDFLGLKDEEDYEKFYNNMRYNDEFFRYNFNKLTNKQKQKVIAFYIANAENLMSNTMYSKIVNDLIMRDKDPYNEILMNKFKVLGVYSIEYGKFKFNHENAQSIIEDMGYKYLGHIPKSEFKNVTPETY
jgi:hypothetical protein